MPGAAEATAFRGVGRVTVAGRGFCTGSLISPRLVLTAAHCLYDARSRRRVPIRALRFVPASPDGRRQEGLRVARAATAPAFRFSGRPEPEAVAADLALLELARPLEAAPLPMPGAGPARGEALLVVAYGRGRIGAPGLHDGCSIRARFRRVLALGCRLGLGGSGAPIFAGEGAARRLVRIVSASGRDPTGADITLAVEPGANLATLREALAANAPETPARPR